MRLHLLSLPWTNTTRQYLHCAYTQKVVKFCKMMGDLGHEVILYSNEENEAECAEHVPIFTEALREGLYGPWDGSSLFADVTWEESDTVWRAWNGRAAREVAKRKQPGELLLLTCPSQAQVWTENDDMLGVEWAVGYSRLWANVRIFESYAWKHHVYGLSGIHDGQAFDSVIPNFFDPRDFTPLLPRDDYLLFMGRLIWRKGLQHAVEIAQASGRRLIIAGPGATEYNEKKGILRAPVGNVNIEAGPGVFEYVGPADWEMRRDLLAQARVCLMPTQYIEPFGGVAVEAMMSGCPVVASDWGAFTETVEPGRTGYRYNTLAEAVEAIERAEQLHPLDVSHSAYERFSLAAVGPQFEVALSKALQLFGDGWYAGTDLAPRGDDEGTDAAGPTVTTG